MLSTAIERVNSAMSANLCRFSAINDCSDSSIDRDINKVIKLNGFLSLHYQLGRDGYNCEVDVMKLESGFNLVHRLRFEVGLNCSTLTIEPDRL